MLFTFEKCKCLHTGSENTGMNYEMGGTNLLLNLRSPRDYVGSFVRACGT